MLLPRGASGASWAPDACELRLRLREELRLGARLGSQQGDGVRQEGLGARAVAERGEAAAEREA